jgi:hypothetical protein
MKSDAGQSFGASYPTARSEAGPNRSAPVLGRSKPPASSDLSAAEDGRTPLASQSRDPASRLERGATGHIVHGGGWVEGEPQWGRPKARFCALASLLWIFPSAGALFILVPGFRNWSQAGSFLEGLGAVSFEQWIALIIVLAHLMFAALAWHYRRTEPLREEAGWEPNPDQDLRKLR